MANEQLVMALIRASRPTFRNDHDKVAFAVHATFLASGYILNATGSPAFVDDALTSVSADEVGIDHWNDFEDTYAFVYSNSQKNEKRILVKCLVMNDKLLVDALAEGSSYPVHLEINVSDYSQGNERNNYTSQFKNLEKLASSLDEEILTKLSGSSGPSSATQTSSSATREGQRENMNQSIAGIREPYSSDHPLHPSGVLLPPVHPTIGGSDLFPGPGAGMYPTRANFGGGSMLVGPNDPRFFGGIGREPGFPGGLQGVPPGARFDPYGPPGVPGFEPNRFFRNPRNNRGRGHPDLEHFGGGFDFI